MTSRTLETRVLTWVRDGIPQRRENLTPTQIRAFVESLQDRAKRGERISTIRTEHTRTIWPEPDKPATIAPLLARMIAHIDAADWRPTPRISEARASILDMAANRITRAQALERMIAAGWTDAQAAKIISREIAAPA